MREDTLLYYKIEKCDHGRKLEHILRGHYGFSRKLVQKLKANSAVRLDGEKVYLTSRGCCGQVLAVDLSEPEEQNVAGEDLPLEVLYEDAFYIAVNKPPGQIVHPVGPHVRGTLANAVVGYWQRRGESKLFRPVFRIDRDTSGVVLIAKNRFAHQQIVDRPERKRQAAGKAGRTPGQEGKPRQEVTKIYWGLVQGVLPKDNSVGILDFPLRPKPGSKIQQEIHPHGRYARTEYRVLERDAEAQVSLVEFRLVTGRTHQIRVHCQGIGHPLLGDTLYGGDGRLFSRQALHACRYAFCHPFLGETVAITAPLPSDMRELIDTYWTGFPEASVERGDIAPTI